MSTFNEANQARIALKMKLSQYSWYGSSIVMSASDGYTIVIMVKRLDNRVRKVIPTVVNGVGIKVELE